MSPGRGLFITLEGGEGAGKSTLARDLAGVLAARSREVALTREPGGSPGADEIRGLLVRGGPERWSALTEALLLFAARNDHLERTIRPALARGAVVLCDRYVDSSRAYQGGAAVETLRALIDAPTPDLTLLLDIDPEVGLARSRGAAAGEDRFERRGLDWHREVRARFLALAAADPARFVVLDGGARPDLVLEAALRALEGRL